MIAEPLEKGLAEDIENEVVQITWNRREHSSQARAEGRQGRAPYLPAGSLTPPILLGSHLFLPLCCCPGRSVGGVR